MGTNSPDFIKPVSQRKGGIEALFAKQAAKGKQSSLTSLKEQVSPTATSTPSASKDGKSLVQAIDVDVSPPPSPSLTPSLDARKQISSAGVRTRKHRMVGDPEGEPPKKRAKDTAVEHEKWQD